MKPFIATLGSSPSNVTLCPEPASHQLKPTIGRPSHLALILFSLMFLSIITAGCAQAPLNSQDPSINQDLDSTSSTSAKATASSSKPLPVRASSTTGVGAARFLSSIYAH